MEELEHNAHFKITMPEHLIFLKQLKASPTRRSIRKLLQCYTIFQSIEPATTTTL